MDKGKTELDVSEIKAQTDTLPRKYSNMIFWSEMDDVIDLSATVSDINLPDVVVAGLPSGFVLVRVTAFVVISMIENTSDTGANGINGTGKKIRIKKSTGTWGVDDIVAIDLPDNAFLVAASTREGGRPLAGKNDVKAEVDDNGTYNLRFEDIVVDYNYLRLNDVLVGLQVWFY